ncbi:Chs5p-Arf1p-binding proteins-domain-containing protein [Gamsiella multidivaricata]|uniref:Chs5p-Arf1p-binding proteins-domain-containing protein n=1 Tax=Gamsiella multidivaricata TaxID=101098 RepID=UPI00221E9206|nr:Chs5p-Arf1p-binding proteins-domain-containing protein [Gamsiella multidivaricata]KAI7824830.1 Chs5p-Arf1p-binding proteins-domain-containing protein [Gamsiella multidivaricata]
MTDNLRDIPEFIERELGESLQARTDALSTFKELGAPDLCHIIKVNVKPNVKETSSYHYVSGIDASSSASLAAYLNSLTYAIDESHAWFSKGVQWRIRSGVYCCYNAFSRVDVRVEVKIPGGVESYAVNIRGERQEATAAIWQETYVTAMLRSVLYSDDVNYRIPGFRKLDPIPDVDAENRFFEAAEQLFFKGWLLGSSPEIQVPTIVNNHLTAAIMKYCQESFRYDLGVKFFERLFKREPEVASLLAQSYIGTDEELKAINVLYQALKQFPQSYALLHVQADFLRGKGKLEMALRLAKQAVNCAPSEFITWAKLTEVYIDLGDYESALLTLNSCPMFTFNERDLQRMPKPAKAHLPIRNDIDLSLIDDETGREHEADPALLRLPAPSLRGTFASAYNLLTRLVSKIGWDELLRCRSLVFVMEEEYRMQKEAEENIRKGSQARSKSHDEGVPEVVPARDQLLSPNGTPIPIIKISTESEREREREQEEAEEEERVKAVEEAAAKAVDENPDQSMEDIKLDDLSLSSDKDQEEGDQNEKKTNDEVTEAEKEAEAGTEAVAEISEESAEEEVQDTPIKGKQIEKPSVAAASDEEENEDDEVELSFSFSNKRLCDRWLDNLFMVLYEDLRQYTIWRAEVQHFRSVQAPYRKSGTDWEIYGDLATRLHHREEAKDAYQRCAEQKFSAKALVRLLEIYAEEGQLLKAMEASIKLCVYQERWYHETIFPTAIAYNLNKLIQSEGLAKVQNTLIALNTSPAVFKLMSRFLARAKTFDVPGSSA